MESYTDYGHERAMVRMWVERVGTLFRRAGVWIMTLAAGSPAGGMASVLALVALDARESGRWVRRAGEVH